MSGMALGKNKGKQTEIHKFFLSVPESEPTVGVDRYGLNVCPSDVSISKKKKEHVKPNRNPR